MFKETDIISTYTSQQAINDGYLVDMTIIPQFAKSIVNYITTGLMNKGYMTEQPDRTVKFNIPNLMDLYFAITVTMRRKPKDWFYSLKIQLPSGAQQQIFVAQNETSRYTAMLPGEY